MRRETLLLIVAAILGMLVTLGLSGCGLFGGGDDEAAAPDGAPPEGADTAMDPAMEAAPPDDMGAPPPEGEPGAMPPEGTAPEGAPAGGGGDAASLVAEGMAYDDWASGVAQIEEVGKRLRKMMPFIPDED